MTRRRAVPAALALVMVSAAVVGLWPPAESDTSPTTPAVRAGVLSPRRVPALVASALAEGRLHRGLDRVLRDPELGGGRDDSCLVVSQGGRTLYDRNADRSLTPASTLKLLTAAAALRTLTPTMRFATSAIAPSPPADGVLTDDLWLVGGGDPLLGTADYAASFEDQPRRFTDLTELANAVAGSGLRRVEGRVMGDESRYDLERYRPTWKPGYTSSGNVGPLSALAVNDGFASWTPGHVPSAAPARHAAGIFTALLKARGVEVTGDPGEGTLPRTAAVVATLQSLSLREIVAEMLTHSDNDTAELLTKEIGRKAGGAGTTSAGVTAIRKTLADTGLDVSAVATTDGSGLDSSDKVTCDVLHSVLSRPGSEPLVDGLAIAGKTGTMLDQFQGHPAAGRLRAKTGALEGVVGLAGLVQPAEGGGTPLIFAFLANSLPTPSHTRGERFQERLGAALAAFPDAPATDSLAP